MFWFEPHNWKYSSPLLLVWQTFFSLFWKGFIWKQAKSYVLVILIIYYLDKSNRVSLVR